MKILQITPFYPPDNGGISNHVFNISNYLIKNDVDVLVVSPTSFKKKQLQNNFSSIRLKSIYLPKWPYPTLSSISIPIDIGYNLNKIIKRYNPNVIHIHGHHYPLSWLGIILSKKYGIPSVLTLHGMYALDPKSPEGRTLFEEAFNQILFKRLLNNTSAVIGLTERITDYAKKYDVKKQIKYYTIPNGINVKPFKNNIYKKSEYRKKYNIKEDALVILFRGRFEQVKGVIEFTEAIIKIMENKSLNIEVVMVGEGSLKNKVISLLKSQKKVHIMGWQPMDQIHEIYILSDIYVIPSKFEALPITIIEAMNAHLHILYTSVGGISQILQNYSNKTLLDKGNVSDIHDSIIDIIETKKTISINSLSQSYAENFDWDQIIKAILKIYLETQENYITS